MTIMMNKEQVEEAAVRLEEVLWNAFHDVMVNTLEVRYYDDEWDVTDEDIRDIKNELIRLLKL